jgi:AraC-like DNA-binding protein
MEGAPILIKIQLILCYLLQLIYFLQIIISFLKVRIFITDYNENISNFYSNLEDKTLEWPRIILNSFIVTSVFSIFTSFAGRSFFDKWPFMLLIACIAYSVFLFFLGYLGYMQNHTIVTLEQDTLILCENETIQINPKKIQIQLLKLFNEEQIYKNPDLKITDISSRLNTNRTYISTIINNDYACSFSTFVNRYRVEEAKKVLLNDKYSRFSLEHISTLIGFGSLHTYNRVFKEITGTTPSQYRKTTPKPPTDKMIG